MNFSKKGTLNKQREIKSTSKRVATKARVSVFRILLLSLVAIVIIGAAAGIGIIKSLIDKAPNIEDIGLTPTGYTTNLYDSDGNLIETLIGAESNRVYATLDEIPDVVENAFIAIEDERFRQHDGIDIRGIFRAFFKGLSKGNFDEGASTITQQLIKNQVFNGGSEDTFVKRFERKVQEQYLAIKIDNAYSKDEILERYINTINLGQGTYGVQTASNRYFNKDVNELTLSEATVIAVITQSPVNLNPIKYPEKNAARREICLSNMLRLGFITQKQYDKALADDVYDRIQNVNEEYATTSYYSYFVDEVISQAIDDMVNEKGYSETEAYKKLYSGGLSIYTTQDSAIQKIVDNVYSDKTLFPKLGVDAYYELTYALSIEKPNGKTVHYHTNDLANYYKKDRSFNLLFVNKEAMQEKIDAFKASVYNEKEDKLLGEKVTMTIQPQSSFVVMDQHTGYVVALVGGLGEKTGNRTLNRATSSVRQPGSTFKIISTYLPALDTAGMTLGTVVDDAPYNYPGTTRPVNNWQTNVYKGYTTLREAIYNSMNVVTVKTLEQVTPQVGFDYLKKLGFTTLIDKRVTESGKHYTDIQLPLALGGITDGVTNLELTASYAAIANSGTYIKPTLYTKIIDHDGKVLINKKKPKSEQVMKESTAWLLTNAMEDVVKRGTGRALHFRNVMMPVAGKTGTTSSNYDTWFSGYTPYYTASIWSGYDQNNKSQTNRYYHKNVWREIMERIHKEKSLKSKSFPMPDSIVSAYICTKSGKLAVDGLCDHALGGSTVRLEYFAKGTAPTEKCDIHVKLKIDKKTDQIATEFCPEKDTQEVVYLVKEETAKTNDSKYIRPTEECTLHTKETAPEEEVDEELPDVEDNTDTNNPEEETETEETSPPDTSENGETETPEKPTPPPVVILPDSHSDEDVTVNGDETLSDWNVTPYD